MAPQNYPIHRPAFREFGCDQYPLHYACRIGDLDQVRYLVDSLHVNINQQDDYDATPLYLASLTGQKDICRFLLERGAECDPHSGGDAARVFYVALTPELRKLLQEWSLTAAARDEFLDLVRRWFNEETRADCIVGVSPEATEGGEEELVYVHRYVLLSRCPSLGEFIQQQDDKERKDAKPKKDNQNCFYQLSLPSPYQQPSNREVIKKIMEYLYTGCMDMRNLDQATMAAKFAIDLELWSLFESLQKSIAQYEETLSHLSRIKKSVGPCDEFDSCSSLTFRCTISDGEAVRADLARAAYNLLTSSSQDNYNHLIAASRIHLQGDVTVACHNKTWSLHSFVLCTQSDYFRCALEGPFRESHQARMDVSHLVPSADVMGLGLHWLYSDTFSGSYSAEKIHKKQKKDEKIQVNNFHLTMEQAVHLVELGSALLCPRLSAHAANTVLFPALEDFDKDNWDHRSGENDPTWVFDLLELARLYTLERLEDKCVQIMAMHLETFVKCPRMQPLLEAEIASTLQSQCGNVNVTDVPLVAELRSWIRKTKATMGKYASGDSADGDGRMFQKEYMMGLLDSALRQALDRHRARTVAAGNNGE